MKQLTTICLNLNCTPNDIFVLGNMQLPAFHQLHNLKTIEEHPINPRSGFEHMSLDEIRKVSREVEVK